MAIFSQTKTHPQSTWQTTNRCFAEVQLRIWLIFHSNIWMFFTRILMAATTKDLVQYIIVRGDLKWPKGALIGMIEQKNTVEFWYFFNLIYFSRLGNGSHASVAAIFSNMNDQDTSDYLKDLDNMTKVVLKAENEEQIVNAAKTLEDNNVKHYIWREQPENIFSALATVPRSREILKPLLSEFKLFRWFKAIINQSFQFFIFKYTSEKSGGSTIYHQLMLADYHITVQCVTGTNECTIIRQPQCALIVSI